MRGRGARRGHTRGSIGYMCSEACIRSSISLYQSFCYAQEVGVPPSSTGRAAHHRRVAALVGRGWVAHRANRAGIDGRHSWSSPSPQLNKEVNIGEPGIESGKSRRGISCWRGLISLGVSAPPSVGRLLTSQP